MFLIAIMPYYTYARLYQINHKRFLFQPVITNLNLFFYNFQISMKIIAMLINNLQFKNTNEIMWPLRDPIIHIIRTTS